MTEYSGGRASIHVRCSPAFKAKLAAYATSKGLNVSDVVIEELATAMQFFDFEAHTEHSAAAQDWETLAVLAQEDGKTP